MWEISLGEVIKTPYFKPKKKTTYNFKRRPKVGENTKGSTYGKVRKDGVKMHYSNFGGEGITRPHAPKGHLSSR